MCPLDNRLQYAQYQASVSEYDSEVPYSGLRALMMREREIPGRNTVVEACTHCPYTGNRMIRHISKGDIDVYATFSRHHFNMCTCSVRIRVHETIDNTMKSEYRWERNEEQLARMIQRKQRGKPPNAKTHTRARNVMRYATLSSNAKGVANTRCCEN